MRRVQLACLVAASLTFAACSDARDTSPVATTAAPVIHGTLDTGTTHDTVVYLSFLIDAATGMGGACTGTLIAPNVVATARHCVSNINESVYPPTVGADFVPKNIKVYMHTNPVGTGAFHSSDGYGVTIVHDGATTLENSDFALLVLNKNISTDYSPVRLAAAPTNGERVYVVGYGLTELSTDKTPEPMQRYWRDNLAVSGVGTSSGVGSRELWMGESICQGDSGGPVMDHTTGALLAVTSRGGNGKKGTTTNPSIPCVGSSTQNIFTRVDGFAAMIKSTLATVGRIPWEEGAPKPDEPTTPPPPPPPEKGALGATCASPADCNSGICIGVGGAQLCSQTCDSTTPCPSGYECNSGYCAPASAPPPPPADAGTTPPPAEDGGTGNPDDVNTSSKGGCSIESRSSNDNESGVGFFGLVALVGLGAAARTRRRGA